MQLRSGWARGVPHSCTHLQSAAGQRCSSVMASIKGSGSQIHRSVGFPAAHAPAVASTQQHTQQRRSRIAYTDEQIAIKSRAKSARLSGNPQLALDILLAGIEQYPHDHHLLAAAASTAAKLGDAALALQILSPALQESPHNVHLLTAAAAAHARMDNPTSARQCYQAAAAAQPNNVVVLQAWGVLEASCGNTATAVSLFKQAVAADPRHVPVYVAWARLEAEHGRGREARLLHQQGHQQDPSHTPNLHAWAELESCEGQWLTAIKLLEQALAADSKHLPSWMLLGKAHWSLGDSAAARRVYQQACQTLGPRPELLNQWVALEQQAQRIPAARAVLGFMDSALQQQGRQQQHGRQQGQQQHPQKEQGQTSSQQQQPVRQRRKRQQQQQQHQQAFSEASGREQPQHADSPEAADLQPNSKQAAPQVAQPGCDAASSSGQQEAPSAARAEELLQQLQQLVAALNSQSTARWPTATAALVNMSDTGRQIMPAAEVTAASASSSASNRDGTSAASWATRSDSTSSPGSSSSASAAGQSQQQMQQQQQQDQQQQQQQQGMQQAMRSSNSSSSSNAYSLPGLPGPAHGLLNHIPGLASAAAMEHRAGNTTKALRLYKAALEQDPSNPRLLYALAQLHLKCGDRADAEAQLAALEQVEPGNGFLCHCRGLSAQQEGQLAVAREWFEKGMRAPGSEQSLLNCEALAELHAFMGDASAARATLAAGLTSRRPTARFLRMAGLVEKRLGDVDAAAKLLARAVARAPRDYRSWLAWAVLERRRRDYAAAARCFQRGTACAPGNPHIWYAWAAMTWRDLRDYRAARRLYEQATAHCPRNAPLWMEWAMLEWDEAANPSKARQLFQAGAAVPQSYQHPPLYQAWAQREAAAGNTAFAEQLHSTSYEAARIMKGSGAARPGQK